MRFYLRKKRQPPAVIIVALIDVLIVVLIFLMVTTSFKKPLLPSLKLALPTSSSALKPGAKENPPLVITIEPGGNLRVGTEGKPVTLEILRSTLRTEAAKNPEIKVVLNADERAPWGLIVKVRDAAKEASIKEVTAYSKPAGP